MRDLSSRLASLSPAKRDLLTQRLNSSEQIAEPIAIVGMSCRFAGANSLDEYWRLIREGRNATQVVPPNRWDAELHYDENHDQPGRMSTKWGCFIDDVDHFDPVFFGISPREAARMDPQQRLLLQISWEAMEHANIVPQSLSESPTGVYIGVGQFDYTRIMAQYDNSLNHLDAHCGTGGSLSISANRLSYIFDFTGPSASIDTACSSALVAVHQAVQSLRRRECRAALAGGVNVVLSPESTISLSKARMLSPTGACRPFDSLANGYVRGEGCGVVVLKRLSDAVSDGDQVVAIIRGSAVNHGGRTSGITAPNAEAQRRVVRAALADGGVLPQQVGYIEAHGTGTPLGDPIEIESLSSVFQKNGVPTEPVYLTSVKANIGHTEIAAGIAGLIKAALIVQHGYIAPQSQLDELNPHLRFKNTRITIPDQAVEWNSDERFAGVSSFGFGGTNSHVVLQSASVAPSPSTPSKQSNGIHPVPKQQLLTLSARTDSALSKLAERYRSFVDELPDHQLADFCFTTNTGRTHFPTRATVNAENREELITGLDRISKGKRSQAIRRGRPSGRRQRTAALFTGQGSQRINMGMELFEEHAAFRDAFQQCDAILTEIRGQSLLAVIRGEVSECDLHDTEWTQPSLFALEYSLAELWKSWGFVPEFVLGHSVGEYAAACLAEVFDVSTGMRLIAERSRLMQRLPVGGAMAVLMAPGDRVAEHLQPYEKHINVAAFNGPTNTTISGTAHAVQRVIDEATKAGLIATKLEVSHAFHSALMEPALDAFESFADQFEFHAPRIPIVSNLTGRIETEAIFNPFYWRNHIRQPVRFAEGVEKLAAEDVKVLLEFGPSATLLGMAAQCVEDWTPATVRSLRKEQPETQALFDAVADLHTRGILIDWRGFHAATKPKRQQIPGYPLENQRYWFEPDHATTHIRDYLFGASHVTPILGSRVAVADAVVFENTLTEMQPRYLHDHRVTGAVLLPGSAYLEMALGAAKVVFGEGRHCVEKLLFQKGMFLSDKDRKVQMHVMGSGARRRFSVYSRLAKCEPDEPWDLHASGEISIGEGAAPAPIDLAAIEAQEGVRLSGDEFYATVNDRGMQYGPHFQIADSVCRFDGEAVCYMNLHPSVVAQKDAYAIHPAIGDGCLQTMTGIIPLEPDGSYCPDLYLPASIGRVSVYAPIDTDAVYYVRRTSPGTESAADVIEADAYIVSRSGVVLAEFEGARLHRVARGSRDEAADPKSWLYQTKWSPAVDSATGDADAAERLASEDKLRQGRYLVVTDESGFARSLSTLLKPLATRMDVVQPGDVRRVLNERILASKTATQTDERLNIICCRALDTQLPEAGDLSALNSAQEIWVETFELLQQMSMNNFGGRVAVWIVTKGARVVLPNETPAVQQSPLTGTVQAATLEMRNQNCRVVDLDPQRSNAENATQLAQEISLRDSESAVAFRDGTRWVPRIVRTPDILDQSKEAFSDTVPNDSAYRLRLGTSDTIDGLRFEKIARKTPDANEVEIEVRAAGLNFSDVLKSIGLYPGITDDIVPLGIECSGIVTKVGTHVTRFKIGDEVIGVAPYCFASHCVTPDFALVQKPKELDHEEAATIPLAFLTAYYCLKKVARLQAGERVLIHAGAGGVGMAAIQIAQHIGAEIFATAGSDEKRDFLRGIGVPHVMNSRTLEFAEQIREITNGKGVDVVLNSLPGEAIDRSLDTLGAYGRFVEIGKVDIYQNRQVGLLPFQDNLSYAAVDLDRLFRERPHQASELIEEMMQHFYSGDYQPLNMTLFQIEEVVGAFRYMSQRKNIGKIIVSIDVPDTTLESTEDEAPLIRSDASYLVTGGLGALGLATAEWLVDRGAGGVVLMSRRTPGEATQKKIDAIGADSGSGRIVVASADVCDRPSLDAALAALPGDLPPLKGVFHAAGVLKDALVGKMTTDEFVLPLGPKTIGTWNLHSVFLPHELDLFVMYSSVSSVVGTPGQANYGAANCFLDEFAEFRRSQGLSATTVNWGPFAGEGMATTISAEVASSGVSLLPVRTALELMEPLVASRQPRVTVVKADWTKYTQLLSALASGDLRFRFTEELASQDSGMAGGLDDLDGVALKSELGELPSEERIASLQEFFSEQLAEIMGLEPEDIDRTATLNTMGLDSLMAIELGNKMQKALEIALPMSVYLEGPTIETLAEFVNGELSGDSQSVV